MATVDSSNMSTSNRGNPADRNQNSLQQEVHELASQLRALKQRRSCTCSLINLLGFLIGILGMLIAISATTDLRQYSVVNFILQTSSGERFKDMETLEIQQSLIAENQVLKKKLEAVEQRQIIGESPKDTQALIAENQLLKKKL